jgi:hypothetical protein
VGFVPVPESRLKPLHVEVGEPGTILASLPQGSPLRRALLTYFVLSGRGSDAFNTSPINIFYNRYYWFLVFAKLYHAAHGFDAGIEQQGFQLLETAPPGVDWNCLEAIEADVRGS